MQFRVLVEASPKEGIADPQGTTIEEHLPVLGWSNVSQVRVGKAIRLTVEADSEDAARRQVDDMCRRFLANPVLEDWRGAVGGEKRGAGGGWTRPKHCLAFVASARGPP